jgi:hypothetical protein
MSSSRSLSVYMVTLEEISVGSLQGAAATEIVHMACLHRDNT